MKNRNKYPANWEEIAHAVKSKSHWRCESCGHTNDYESAHILTVHHIDGNPTNNTTPNLIALCQRCHLREHGLMTTGNSWMILSRKGTKTLFKNRRKHA